MSQYSLTKENLRKLPCVWLITGVAGFIGSHLLENLLLLDQNVVGIDNFFTGKQENLKDVQSKVTKEQWARFSFIEGDICDFETCSRGCAGVHYVLHQAALCSVPLSMENPRLTHQINVTGTFNVFLAAKRHGAKRVVYASSSAVYGDDRRPLKTEDSIGRPLSPYALTKYYGELYADLFFRIYELENVGLRYFNVFGPRQDVRGSYAAVIPRWISQMLQNASVEIFGDGKATRDFCYVEDVVQANILSATAKLGDTGAPVYNVGLGQKTSILMLYRNLQNLLPTGGTVMHCMEPSFRPARAGDILHSQSDVKKIKREIKFEAAHSVLEGLKKTTDWYKKSS